jgi:hypothetical protein
MRALMGHPSPMTFEGLEVVGWVLTEEAAPPDYAGEVIGPRLLTISDCIQPELPRPDPWLGDWFQDREQADVAAAALGRPNVRVTTVAMSPADADDFARQWGETPTPWFDLMRRGLPLSPSATVLGYEIVGAEEPLDFHSWHCHGYADEVNKALGVTLNDHGLLDRITDAHEVLTWMLTRPQKDAPKEVPWTVVALAL